MFVYRSFHVPRCTRLLVLRRCCERGADSRSSRVSRCDRSRSDPDNGRIELAAGRTCGVLCGPSERTLRKGDREGGRNPPDRVRGACSPTKLFLLHCGPAGRGGYRPCCLSVHSLGRIYHAGRGGGPARGARRDRGDRVRKRGNGRLESGRRRCGLWHTDPAGRK